MERGEKKQKKNREQRQEMKRNTFLGSEGVKLPKKLPKNEDRDSVIGSAREKGKKEIFFSQVA